MRLQNYDARSLVSTIKGMFTLPPSCRVSMAFQLLARLFTSQPKLPTFDELPPFHDMPGCGWVWGEDDQLGTVNLLSDEVVRRACSDEVRYANTICRRGFLLSVLNVFVLVGLGSRYPSTGPSLELLPPGRLLTIG